MFTSILHSFPREEYKIYENSFHSYLINLFLISLINNLLFLLQLFSLNFHQQLFLHTFQIQMNYCYVLSLHYQMLLKQDYIQESILLFQVDLFNDYQMQLKLIISLQIQHFLFSLLLILLISQLLNSFHFQINIYKPMLQQHKHEVQDLYSFYCFSQYVQYIDFCIIHLLFL